MVQVARLLIDGSHPLVPSFTFAVSQMVVGVATTLTGFYYLKTDPTCEINEQNTNAGFLLYGSYLFLFTQFFVSRYFGGDKSTVKKRPKQL